MTRTRLLYVIRAAVSVIILVLLARLTGWERIGATLGDTRLEWVVTMYAVAILGLTINAAMLRHLLGVVGLHVSLRRVFLANTLGTFYTLLLPSDVLAGMAKWANLSAATGDRPRVLSALVLAKIALALPPLVLGALALAADNPFASRELPLLAAAVATALVLVVGLAFSRATGQAVDAIARRLLQPIPTALRSRLESLFRGAASFRALTTADRILVLSLSLLAFALGVLAMGCATKAVGATVPARVLAWVALTLFLTRMLPITLSNIGVREGVLVGAFGLYRVDAASAISVGFIMFSSTLLVALVGATYQIALLTGRASWRVR